MPVAFRPFRRMLHPVILVGSGVFLGTFCGCHGGSGGTSSVPSPSFTLSVSPASLSIPAGGGGYATVTLTRIGGFDGTVTLALDGAPPGVTGSGTIAAGAGTGQLSLLVDPTMAPQSLDALRLKGTAGSLTQMIAFRLVVAPALPPGQIRADQVQASGGIQRAGNLENAAVAQEPVGAATSKDAGGTTEVRHGFDPSTTSR